MPEPNNEPMATRLMPSPRRLGGYMSAAATRICCTAPTPLPKTKAPTPNRTNEPIRVAMPMVRAPTNANHRPRYIPALRPRWSVSRPTKKAVITLDKATRLVATPAKAALPKSVTTWMAPRVGTSCIPAPLMACAVANSQVFFLIWGGMTTSGWACVEGCADTQAVYAHASPTSLYAGLARLASGFSVRKSLTLLGPLCLSNERVLPKIQAVVTYWSARMMRSSRR